MSEPEKPISLITADLTMEGVVVVFSDDKTVLFKTDFLYQSRNYDGNKDLSDMLD